MIDISTLNENQKQAVTWTNGPLLVLAGPGSGKTRVLTYRIAHILEKSAGEYFRILALTFTNKAAAEMRKRIEEIFPSECSRTRLTTFHSFAAELLQQHGSHINLRPDFTILSNDADRIALIDDVLVGLKKRHVYDLPEHFVGVKLLPAITRLLERCVPVDNAEMILYQNNVDNAAVLGEVYAEYRKALKDTNALDFPSLIAETLDLLKAVPQLVNLVRKVYKHILVDEFQDTNSSQYRLLSSLIAPDPSTLFVVADDDQIIYQWNGASPERITNLRNDFGISEIQLPENYRCPPQVISHANLLIEKNLNRSAGKKPLAAIKTANTNDAIRLYRFNIIDEEARWIAYDIKQRKTQGYTNFAVLARTKKLLEIAGRELENNGVPVYYASRKDEFMSAPLRMLHSILRLANTSEDARSLARLIKAFYEIEGIRVDLPELISKASADGKDYLRTWINIVTSRQEISGETKKLLTTDIMPLLSYLDYRNFADYLLDWAANCQSAKQQEEVAFSEFDEERTVWNNLLAEIAIKFDGEKTSLNQLLIELDLSSKTPPIQQGSVPCYTIHASKGMEFEHVYLMGLVEEQLPSWAAVKSGDLSSEMQEERRNCFVAITRTQETLTLTYSDKVFGWMKKPSRFLKEMGFDI